MGRDDSHRGYWERHARDYDRSMVLFGRPLARTMELTAEAVSDAGDVLEVAAGTGLFTAAISPQVGRLVASDYSPAMVAALRRRVEDNDLANVECTVGDIYTLDHPAGSFDAVVAANVLHLVPDLPGALRTLRGVLRPGGRLVAPTFCHDETRLSWLLSRVLAITGFPGHRRFTVGTLRAALEQSGLRIERSETVPGFVPIGYVDGVFSASS